MPKSSAKKTTKKRVAVKKARPAAKSTASKSKAVKPTAAKKKKNVRVASKVSDTGNCKAPTTLFEVEFPTTVLFWAGVALFFLFILLIAQNVMGI